MAFGSFEAISKTKKQKDKNIKPKNLPAFDNTSEMPDKQIDNIMDISILLVGRTVASLIDYLSGLHANMSSIVSNVGLAFFSEDSDTINELLQKQKRFPLLFIEDNNICYSLSDDTAEESELSKSYSLILSKAGVQSFSFKINFMCATAANILSRGVMKSNVIWFLADAPFFDKDCFDFGGYTSDVSATIQYAKENKIPFYLIAGQFEKLGKIRNKDSICTIERNVYSALTECIKSSFGELVDGCPIIPVQIYGGLICKEIEADGSLAFGEDYSSGINIYKPVACHIPLLYSLELVNTGGQFKDNEIVTEIKKLNRAQRTAFSYAGIETGG